MRSGSIFGIILLVVGALALLSNFTNLWWLQWHYLWPLILIIFGLAIIFGRQRR